MSEGTIRDVLARLEAQEAELRSLRRQLDGPATAQRGQARRPRSARRGWRWRRPTVALLLALLLASVPLGLLATDVWSDVPDDYVHHDDINLITDAGISSGITANTYGPNQFVTRGQMASFIARTAGLGDHDPVVNALTAVTAGTITDQANSATITATSANTPNTIVLRDGSGNFAAGTITANLTGTATTATNATNAENADNADTVDEKHANELIRLVGESGDTVDLTDSYQDLVTVDVTAPAPGFVQVTATLYAFGEAGCPCIVDFQLIDLTGGTPQPVFFTLDLEGFSEDSGGASFVFAVPAGAHTFAVQARIETSDGEATVYSDADIVALYSPFGATGQGGPSEQGPGPANAPNKRRPQR